MGKNISIDEFYRAFKEINYYEQFKEYYERFLEETRVNIDIYKKLAKLYIEELKNIDFDENNLWKKGFILGWSLIYPCSLRERDDEKVSRKDISEKIIKIIQDNMECFGFETDSKYKYIALEVSVDVFTAFGSIDDRVGFPAVMWDMLSKLQSEADYSNFYGVNSLDTVIKRTVMRLEYYGYEKFDLESLRDKENRKYVKDFLNIVINNFRYNPKPTNKNNVKKSNFKTYKQQNISILIFVGLMCFIAGIVVGVLLCINFGFFVI